MQFSAGAVLNRSVSVTLKNFAAFFVIALIVSAPVIALQHMVGTAPINGESGLHVEPGGRMTIRDSRAGPSAGQFAVSILNMVAQGVISGALAYGAFQSLRGQRVGIGDCLSRGFARLLPIIGVSIVTALGTFAGLILLIVPGIMIACAWYVAVPVTTVERVGVGEALKRSGALTKGSRWSIFGLFLLVFAMAIVVMTLLVGTFAALGPVVGFVVSAAVGIFISLFGGVLQAVAYHDLRVSKEGVTTEDLVKVFE